MPPIQAKTGQGEVAAAGPIAESHLRNLEANIWYDVFSTFYDATLEDLYRPWREQLAAAVGPMPGASVLDLGCGTGQNFPWLIDSLGAGQVIGVDASGGMLKRARSRCEKAGWDNVRLIQGDARELSREMVDIGPDAAGFNLLVCTVGFTAFPDWEQVFARAFSLLRPGGRCFIFDVHAEPRIFQTGAVELVARADLNRKVWEPLARAAADFSRVDLGADPKVFGGTLFVASGSNGPSA